MLRKRPETGPRPGTPANPLRRLSGERWEAMEPTWRDAKPGIIHAALERAKARPSGNWFVVGASRDVEDLDVVTTSAQSVDEAPCLPVRALVDAPVEGEDADPRGRRHRWTFADAPSAPCMLEPGA